MVVDRSSSMLELARARQEKLPHEIAGRMVFSPGDVRQIRIPETFDAAVSLFHVVSYQAGNQDLRDCFATAKRHLKSGGVFVFDCWYGPAVLTDRPTVRVKRWEDEGTSVTRIAEPTLHANENIVDVHYTILVRNRVITLSFSWGQSITSRAVSRYASSWLEAMAAPCATGQGRAGPFPHRGQSAGPRSNSAIPRVAAARPGVRGARPHPARHRG